LKSFDYLPSRDGLALLTGGPTQNGYEANAAANPARIWMPRWHYVTQTAGGVMLTADSFGFVDPEAGGWSPFEINGAGNLVIKLRKASEIGVVLNNQFTGSPVEWVTGMLLSRWRFNQKHGVFSARLKMPSGTGLLPAFWLFPTDVSWPPEVYAEYVGNKARFGVVTDGPTRIDGDYDVGDLHSGFHDWTIVVRRDKTTLLIDGTPVVSRHIQGGISEDMMLILSFGLASTPTGGGDMEVQSVDGWRFAPA
jgi:hypothetical protein